MKNPVERSNMFRSFGHDMSKLRLVKLEDGLKCWDKHEFGVT